ncbi:MAG: LysM peptidoglycan-binding domain-containing protein [Elusimicrobiota bacterium]|nr:LysM peptidoglycan-binding domain-containing protein [Elusimicrobiota bacterium]
MSKKISLCSLVLVLILASGASWAEMETVFKVYTVKKGDTLFKISDHFYGEGERWKNIWDFNKYIKKSRWIFPGDELIIPIEREKKIAATPVEPAKETKEEDENFDMFIAPYNENATVPLDFKYAGKISAFTENIAIHAQRSKVIIDAGKKDGIKAKDTFDIYRASKKIYHPETKKIMGVLIRRIGILTVSDDIQDKSCIATVKYSKGPVQIGDFVRLSKDK